MRQAPDHRTHETVTCSDNAGRLDWQSIRAQSLITSYEKSPVRPQSECNELHEPPGDKAAAGFDQIDIVSGTGARQFLEFAKVRL